MAVQMKNPAKRCNADGAGKNDILIGNRMSTVSQKRPLTVNPAFVAGHMAYPFTFDTGHRAAKLWLSAEPAMSLADFRDNRWRAFSCGRHPDLAERLAFNDGFAHALAEHIAGGATWD